MFQENLPEAGTVIEDSRCVGIACGGAVEAGVVFSLIVFVNRPLI